MNVITSPSASVISFRTALSRSSNSPRYLAPATMADMSRATNRLFFNPSGTSPSGYAQGQALHNGGLAHARLADQHRVVLGAAAQNLDGAANLLVPADHRIELAVPGQHGEIPSVLLKCLVGVFGGDGSNPMRSPHLGQRLQKQVAAHPNPIGHGQQQVLGGQVLVAQFGAGHVGGLYRLD